MIDFILGNIGSFGIGQTVASEKIGNGWGFTGSTIYLMVNILLFMTIVFSIYGIRKGFSFIWYTEIMFWIVVIVSVVVVDLDLLSSFVAGLISTVFMIIIWRKQKHVVFFVLYLLIAGMSLYFFRDMSELSMLFFAVNVSLWVFLDFRIREYLLYDKMDEKSN